MSDLQDKPETPQQRDIRLLRQIQGRNIDSFSLNSSPPCPQIDLWALDALMEENYITGVPLKNGSGFPIQFLMVRITIKGRAYLYELEQKELGLISLPAEKESLKLKIKELSDVEHTLLNYWKLADWGERFGMVCFLFGIFVAGVACSKIPWIIRIIDFIREVKI